MKKIMAAAVCYLAWSSIAFSQVVLDDSFPVDSGATFEQMHGAVSSDFLDPRSAQYKGLVVRNKTYKPAICGLVNAKNSLGGYTPFKPFAYSIEKGDAYIGDGYDEELTGELVVMTLQMMGCPLAAVGL